MPEESTEGESPEVPERLRDLQWVLHQFQANWPLLVKKPVLIVGGLLISASFWLGLHYSSSRVEAANDRTDTANSKLEISNERVSFLNDQIAAYKDRLQGATPDEAAKKIADLSTQVIQANHQLKALLPDTIRSLTDQQKKFIADHKEEFKSLMTKPMMVIAWTQGDSLLFAQDILYQLQSESTKAVGVAQTLCETGERGVMVGMIDPKNPSLQASRLLSLLDEMGLDAHRTIWINPTAGTMDFDIFICAARD